MAERVCCLYRISTTKQVDHAELNQADIPVQRKACREFAEKMGWIIVGEEQAAGVSGFKVSADNRDKLQLIKKKAEQGKFDILLVFMFDRLGRKSDETSFVVEWFVKKGIRVWSVNEGEQRFESHTDRLTNYIRYWQADGESQKTSIRTKAALGQIVRDGRFRGGGVPYGYRLAPSGILNKRKHEVYKLEIDEDEARVVRMMFNLCVGSGYDRVYLSKIFTFTPDFDTVIHADEVITGGTGYKDYRCLPPEVEACSPDYTLYPNWEPAVGFLTRGCARSCDWCVVPRKEGPIRHAAAWTDIKRPDSRKIVFLDNNVLASDHGLEQIEHMGGEPVWVDFNQGLDVRFITPNVARLLAKLHWIRFIRFACDTSEMLPVIQQATAYLREVGAAPSRFWAYVLVRDVEDAHRRVLALRDMDVTPFAQPYRDYDGGEPTDEQQRFARWVNQKVLFKSCSWEDFREKAAKSKRTPDFRHEKVAKYTAK